MSFNTLQDLYISELKDLYNAEQQLLIALPRMAKAASSRALSTAFTGHMGETKRQLFRLETIFTELRISPKGKKCKAVEGMLEEGTDDMAEQADSSVRDAALITTAQRVEHYEMAGYGCVRTFARLLGFDDAADLLQDTLDEERIADKKLTELAETVINIEADKPTENA